MRVAGSAGEVHVVDWERLRGLPATMDEVGAQADQILDHAVRWVANRAGFEPSPVCLLRPLAELMDIVEWAFEQVREEFDEQWGRVREGVVYAEQELHAAEVAAEASVLRLRRTLGEVA